MTKEELTDWAETHHVVVEMLTEPSEFTNKLREKYGIGGLFELGIDLTNEFQQGYRDITWGEEYEWFDTLEDFVIEKLREL